MDAEDHHFLFNHFLNSFVGAATTQKPGETPAAKAFCFNLNLLRYMKLLMSLLALTFFASCHERKPFFEKDKVFAATYGLGAVGSMGFWLYNDHRYQILSSGGIGGKYYSGKYSLNKDTIILNNLNKSCGLQYNRLFIDRKAGFVFQLDERNNFLREKIIVLEITMDGLDQQVISAQQHKQ